jgi:VWFA-related protein
MRPSLKAVLAALLLVSALAGSTAAQAGRNRQKSPEPQKKVEKTETAPVEEQKTEEPEAESTVNPQDIETLRVETNLVTVPVVVSSRGDKYIPDLEQEEFTVYEDGVKQEISFFETVTAPFHVVLMLDTSGSTQERHGQIQQAAISFTEQLQTQDRVKVISFDDRVHHLSDFTSDRAVLQWAIRASRPGQGTKLYDAMKAALNALLKVKGRKAIVIFTDGVDSYSNYENYDKNVRMIEEAGIIIYPIRYDTRADLERRIRQQQQSGQIIDLATILGGRGNTTPPTFPGGSPVPGGGGGTIGTGTRLPGGVVISGSKTGGSRRDDRYPPTTDPTDPNHRNDPTLPSDRTGPKDTISAELDMLYYTADSYLNEIANKSGGTLHRADTLVALPLAFKRIAEELRTQYSLGYYPLKPERDGKYRKIKVKTSRKDTVVRARPGYRTPKGER